MIPLLALLALAQPAAERPTVVIVNGAGGDAQYDVQFRRWATLWQSAAEKGGAEAVRIGDGDESEAADRDRLRDAIASASAVATAEPLWVVLLGHGTFDGREARFNLRGPDVTAEELAGWLAGARRPLVVINCASASGPFLDRLKGADRVVVTATRSGDEQNFARFGEYLAGTIADPAADLDKDGQTSLLEAYLAAGARLAEFYETDARLATEHPLLDDNGDGLGTPAEWFRGIHATKRARTGAPADGLRAHQLHLVPSDRERDVPPDLLARRDALERRVEALRDQKASMSEDDYYARLEPLMLDLARLYREFSAPGPARESRPR
jgi:hypothetical protein